MTQPLIHGGVSTTIYRSGTPALALAASMETALQLALEQLPKRQAVVQAWNNPEVRINSPKQAIPHILNLSVRGVKGAAFQQALDAKGVCVSVKSACSVENTPSRAVFAVSHDRKTAMSSWRISLSHLTTQNDIDGFLSAFEACYKELKK